MKTFIWKTMKSAVALLPLLVVAGLTACGGGGGDDDSGDPATNNAPVVDAGAAQTVLARSDVTLEASATDADGSVASYSWAQTAGTSVTLSATDDEFVEFTAPVVNAAETLTFELTVTDDDGASAKDTVSVTVHPAIAMSAKVYDGPLAGATVTVTVGDQTYTAVTGADGAFELDIGSPDPGTMITIVATGGAGQEFVELVSIAGTFGALMDAAGDDGVLDATESGGVDVTNISTAKAVLMIAANGGAAPSDDMAIVDLEKSIDSNAMLELATVIKLVIDEGVALPDDVDSTLDLVESETTVDAVITAAETETPGAFNTALNAILADPNLMPSFKAGSVPNLYFVNRAGYYMYANRGFHLELNDDGSGSIYGNGSSLTADITWSVDAGVLKIAIDETDPLEVFLNCDTTSGHVSCLQTTTSMEIRMISDGVLTDAINVRQLGTLTYPFNAELAAKDFDNSYNRLGMAPGALKQFTVADIDGTWSVPLSTRNTTGTGAEYETGLLTFNTDGTGTRQADAVAFTWSIDAESGVLGIVFADGDQLDVYWLRDEGDMAIDAMFVMNTAGGDTYAVPTLAAEVDEALAAELTVASADGVWGYMDNAGLVYDLDSSTELAIARYLDLAGEVTDEYPAAFAFDGSKYDVITWWDINANAPVTSCAGVAICKYDYSSSWYPLSEDETGRVFILEIDNGWYYDAGATDDHYRGALYYHHAQNRWLAPVSMEAAAKAGPRIGKRSTGEVRTQGDRVRAALGDLEMQARHH